MSAPGKAVGRGVCALALLALLVLLGACEAVPSLTFEGEDGGMAAPGCPGNPPQGTKCCDTVICYGSFCTAANCATCMNCSAGETCCTKNATMPMCLSATMTCR